MYEITSWTQQKFLWKSLYGQSIIKQSLAK